MCGRINDRAADLLHDKLVEVLPLRLNRSLMPIKKQEVLARKLAG
jgi:hypothetical protein